MLNVLVSVLVLLAGLLMYGFAKNPKLERVGEVMFAAGLLAALLTAPAHVHLP